jgi:hypothetical protein
MKRFLLAGFMVLALTLPAMADVNVYENALELKLIFEKEFISIFKDIDFFVDVCLDTKVGAEAKSFVNQTNKGNEAYPLVDTIGVDPANLISESINFNKGIVGVNQAVGNMNNQANVVAIAASNVKESKWGWGKDGFAHAQIAASQENKWNDLLEFCGLKVDLIKDSINFNKGIVGVNQTSGNMNNQLNQVALAVTGTTFVAMSEADLGQKNAYNGSFGFGTARLDTICHSINFNKGIVGVNQSAGSMNNQANTVSIATTKY